MEQKNFNKKEETLSHKVGESVERLGEKITRAGAPKVGKAVYNVGDKIEHMSDEEETVTPVSQKPT